MADIPRRALASVILGIIAGSALVVVPHFAGSVKGPPAPFAERAMPAHPPAAAPTAENQIDLRIVGILSLSFLIAAMALFLSRNRLIKGWPEA